MPSPSECALPVEQNKLILRKCYGIDDINRLPIRCRLTGKSQLCLYQLRNCVHHIIRYSHVALPQTFPERLLRGLISFPPMSVARFGAVSYGGVFRVPTCCLLRILQKHSGCPKPVGRCRVACKLQKWKYKSSTSPNVELVRVVGKAVREGSDGSAHEQKYPDAALSGGGVGITIPNCYANASRQTVSFPCTRTIWPALRTLSATR